VNTLSDKSTVLAIESAIEGGSIALFSGEALIDSIAGNRDVSRAADLLPSIDRLLSSNGLTPADLGFIAVSRGPGSYTGIRIGIATALGLARSIGAPCIGISALEALALPDPPDRGVITALPVGREDVAWQRFGRGREPLEPPGIGKAADLFTVVRDHPGHQLVCHSGVLARLSAVGHAGTDDAFDAGRDIALLIGRAALQGGSANSLVPIYLLNPARDRGLF
jgi:tRNA threonylcarbamoyl adenosine modification protein YeaZ